MYQTKNNLITHANQCLQNCPIAPAFETQGPIGELTKKNKAKQKIPLYLQKERYCNKKQ